MLHVFIVQGEFSSVFFAENTKQPTSHEP